MLSNHENKSSVHFYKSFASNKSDSRIHLLQYTDKYNYLMEGNYICRQQELNIKYTTDFFPFSLRSKFKIYS